MAPAINAADFGSAVDRIGCGRAGHLAGITTFRITVSSFAVIQCRSRLGRLALGPPSRALSSSLKSDPTANS
jgi:hypothetical protein